MDENYDKYQLTLNNKNMHRVPKTELENRMKRFRAMMERYDADWEIAYFFSKIGQYYFTGTMQDGVLIIPRDGEAILWVRMSYDRAVDESYFDNIKQMHSFRDVVEAYSTIPKVAYVEKEFLPIAVWERFSKYFPTSTLKPVGPVVSAIRAVKSAYELEQMTICGDRHRHVLEEIAPTILKEGISEAELNGALYDEMIKAGHQGIVRFAMYDVDVILGHVAFGESGLYPTHFNGPGGNMGLGPAVQFLGSRERKLKKGDLVFLDVAVGHNGYQTDKTMTYVFGGELPKEAIAEHQKCVDVQHRVAEMLRPGNTPEQVYQTIMESLPTDFVKNFMGYGKRQVKFLGHSIGLFVDEQPVIAKGFSMPIEENMTFAVEPKKGVTGVGTVGIEDTFIVTKEGGVSITGHNSGLIVVE